MLPERQRPLAEGPYAAPMQDAFASALTGAGGIGLAAQLYARSSEKDVVVSTVLEAELLVHLDTQIDSARRLLALVLAPGHGDPRARRRGRARQARRRADRDGPPRRASSRSAPRCCSAPAPRSACPPPQVTLERLCTLVTPGAAAAACERSAELRGLLAEIAREHGINRALMRQELAFLAHLTRLVGQEPEPGYGRPARRRRPAPRRPPPPIHRALDLQA